MENMKKKGIIEESMEDHPEASIQALIASLMAKGPIDEFEAGFIDRIKDLKQLTDEDFAQRDINVNWIVPACWAPEIDKDCHICPHINVCPACSGLCERLFPFVEENDPTILVGLCID